MGIVSKISAIVFIIGVVTAFFLLPVLNSPVIIDENKMPQIMLPSTWVIVCLLTFIISLLVLFISVRSVSVYRKKNEFLFLNTEFLGRQQKLRVMQLFYTIFVFSSILIGGKVLEKFPVFKEHDMKLHSFGKVIELKEKVQIDYHFTGTEPTYKEQITTIRVVFISVSFLNFLLTIIITIGIIELRMKAGSLIRNNTKIPGSILKKL
jgi:hypothetical protein